jgi:tol-pal system protein YbgF
MKTRMKLLVAVVLIAIAAGPAYPEDRTLMQLQVDIISLAKKVDQIQTAVDQNNAVMKGLVEKMYDQVSTLSGAMQKINQTVDGLKSQNDASAKDLRTIVSGLNSTVNDLAENMSSVRAQINSLSQQMTAPKTQAETLASPADLWRSATLDSLSGDYKLAVDDLQDFLSKYPTDPRVPEAHLLMGDAFFNLKKFDQALPEYDIVLQKYPDSDKTRAALLKKGLALKEANQTQQAQSTLKEVVQKFPNTSEAISASEALKGLSQPAAPRKPPAK